VVLPSHWVATVNRFVTDRGFFDSSRNQMPTVRESTDRGYQVTGRKMINTSLAKLASPPLGERVSREAGRVRGWRTTA